MIIVVIYIWILILLPEVDGYINERKCNVHYNVVDCSRLALTSIPKHLPTHATSLDFSRNNITVVRAFTFQDFQNVTELHLEYNLIQSIDKMAFHGLQRLQQLHLGVNSLTMLPSGVFDNLNCLEYLSIDNNKLKDYQANQIKELSTLLSLRTFSFDIYPNFQFPGQWSTLTKLDHLMIFPKSKKVRFSKEMFAHINVMPITFLHLHKVPYISEDFFEYFPKLNSITLWPGSDLPNNPINQIFRSFGVFKGKNITNIEIAYSRFENQFNLDYNQMKYLWPICLKRLTLHDLYITSIGLYAFQRFSVASKCLEYLEVSENIILGQGGTLYGYIQNLKKMKVLKLLDNTRYNRLKRSEPKNLNVILPRTLEELYIENDIHDYLCNVIFNNSLNLRVLSLKHNHMKSCKGSFKGATNVEYFDMSGWTCTQVSVNLLYGFPNLRTLKAEASLLGKGFKNTANSGSFLSKSLKIRDVNLSSNKITTIPKGLFIRPFEQLSSVNMSHNNLTVFPQFHSRIKQLKRIDLTFNAITHLVEDDIDQIEKLGEVELLLKGNPFQCTCKTLQFLKWLGESKRVRDILDVTCVTDTASRTFMSEVISDLKTFEISCKTKFWLPFAVSITSIVVLAIILTVVFFRYKYAIEYFLLRFKMKMKNYNELQQEYIYDAFISYSHTDSVWVKQFHDKVNSMGFELCLDAKDFIAGESIAVNVINAIDSSRKVIFIITHDFLKSTWGSYEMELTRMHAFQKGREDMVIIVVKDKIKVSDMPKILKSIWFKIICIQWPNEDNLPYNTEERFYEKLKISLQQNEESTGNVVI
ncbi:toll-like receptor 4 [Mytilus edulis]|uniref:toll-like receptor 4 n=1 Tax=Mytilus edulis TaxID=6550 RepID=UPI0039F014C0